MTDEGLNYASWGCRKRCVLIPPTKSKTEYKILSIKLINKNWILLIQSTFAILSMVLAVRIWSLQRKTKTKHTGFQLLFRCVLRTLTFWLAKGFLNDTKNLTSILPYGTIRVICSRFTSGGGPNEGCETTEKSLLNQCAKIEQFKQRRFAKKRCNSRRYFKILLLLQLN